MMLVWIVAYGVVCLAADRLDAAAGTLYTFKTAMSILYIGVLVYALRKKNLMYDYGICVGSNWNLKNVAMCFPLTATGAANVFMCVDGYKYVPIIIIVITVLEVFLEELLFRGVLPKLLYKKYHVDSEWTICVLSGALFAILHIANVFGGADIGYTIIQMLTAFGLGVCLCEITFIFGSLIPAAVIHIIINVTSLYGTETVFGITESSIFLVLAAAYTAYGRFMYNLKKKNKEKREL